MHLAESSILWKSEVDSVERYNQVCGVVNLLECANNAWLPANAPCKVLMGHSVVEAHALLRDEGKLVLVYRGEIIAVITQIAIRNVSHQ